MKYTIEATDTGFKMGADFGADTEGTELGIGLGSVRGISLATDGGHDELEALYAQAERTWDALRRQFTAQRFSEVCNCMYKTPHTHAADEGGSQ